MSGNGYYGRDMRGGPGYRPPPPHLEYRRHPPFDGIPPDRSLRADPYMRDRVSHHHLDRRDLPGDFLPRRPDPESPHLRRGEPSPLHPRGMVESPYFRGPNEPPHHREAFGAAHLREGNEPPHDLYARGQDYRPHAHQAYDSVPNVEAASLSQIPVDLDQLRSTLGGQLGTLLPKGIGQKSGDNQRGDSMTQFRPQADRYDSSARPLSHQDDRLPASYRQLNNQFSQNEHGYEDRDSTGRSRRDSRESELSEDNCHKYRRSQDSLERPPLFAAAASNDVAPKSILKKSILKKADPVQESRTVPEPIDEDDFLYGSSSNTQVEQSSLAQPALKPKFDEKPDAQKIISNPAFTALLKSIGLDDINMAQKIKERQQQDEPKASNLKNKQVSRDNQAFGIDQTASFLSSGGGVVLDDLLKLKRPNELRPNIEIDKDSKSGQSIQPRENKPFSHSGVAQQIEDSLSHRTTQGGRSPPRKRSRSPRRKRSRSPPRKRSRSPPRNRSRSPRRKRSRSPPRNRSRSPPRKRSRSPGKRHSRTPPSDKKRGRFSPKKHTSHSPLRSAEKQDQHMARETDIDHNNLASRWKRVPSPKSKSPLNNTRDFSPDGPVDSLGRRFDAKSQSTERFAKQNYQSQLPPVKAGKTEDSLQDLISRIPGDAKLTRAQFEELMRAHQASSARRTASSDNSPKYSINSGMLPQRSRSPSESSGVLRGSSERERLNSYHDKRLDSSSLTRDAFRESEDFKNFKLVVRTDSSTTRTKRVMDDDLLDTKAQLDSRLKGEGQDMPSERRVIRRVGALGSSTLEKHSMETDKEKYLRELEQAEILKAFGSEPLLTRLTKQEIFNIQQMIEFNKNKLLKSEKQLLMLQDNQSDVMKNLKSASVGEQYHLDKTLGQNIRLQNEITTEIKDLKKLIRDDEMRLEEQTDQERKLREITKKKLAAAKAMEKSGGLVVKEESPPPEKQDRKYRRAIEDKLMGRKSKEQLAEEAANKEAVGKGLISQPGTSVVEYYDPGTHWCKSCNFVAFKLYGYLEHLQTSSHMKRREKIGKPWQPEEVKNPPRKSLISRQETVVQPMKGIEFVHPVDAYYCLLCNFFGGDRATLEHHLKSAEHHKQYENHLTENPMYERRYKVDKEAGLQEAKKLEQKRQEEQERLRAAEREEEERRRDAIKRKEREKQEEEEKRKREKLLKIQAKKKAEVLAITRGGDAGDSDDVVELADEPDEQPKNETPQERIKRELLEKMRAKKAQTAEDQKRFNTESAIAKANRLAQEAKKAQEKVKAKAAEIEKSVYGPKQEEGTLPPPGVFLSQPVVSAAQKAATTESSQASTTQANSVSQAATSVNTTSTISPFVQKMMEMEEKGEIITTASVQKAAAAKRQANTGVMGPPGPPGVSGGHPGVSGGPPGVAGGPPGVPMSPQIRPMGPAAGPINSSMMQARPVRPQMGPQGYWPPRPMMRPVPMMQQQQVVPMQGAANRMMMRPQPMIGSGHMAPPMMHSGPMGHPHMMQQNYSQAGPVVQAQPQYHRAEMEPDLAPPGTTPTLVSSQSKPVERSQEEDSDDSDDSSSSDDTDDTDNAGEHSFSVSSILSQFAADPQAKLSSAFTNTSSDTVSTSSLSYANSSQASAVTATISTPTLTGASTAAATSDDGKLKGTETDLETDNMENMTFTVIDSVGDEAIS